MFTNSTVDPGTETGKLSLIIRDSEEDSVSIVVWGSAEETENLDAAFQVCCVQSYCHYQ